MLGGVGGGCGGSRDSGARTGWLPCGAESYVLLWYCGVLGATSPPAAQPGCSTWRHFFSSVLMYSRWVLHRCLRCAAAMRVFDGTYVQDDTRARDLVKVEDMHTQVDDEADPLRKSCHKSRIAQSPFWLNTYVITAVFDCNRR